MNFFDDTAFDIDCPECGKSIKISTDKVGGSVVCPHCKVTIELKDDGFTEGLDNANKAIDDFLKNL
ncbi:MAG: hypothetical protein PHG19_12155 [Anaerotignum sp.]|nr:hypothetical protein [Anaerotignum sp.]